MARKSIDCRDHPDDTGCTLDHSGEEDEVIRAVTRVNARPEVKR